VPGRLPLTEAGVQTIAALHDPAVRNLWITQSYADLAHRLRGLLDTDQTWCTFAIWASNTAGISIRGEELPRFVDDLLLGADDDAEHIVRHVNAATAGLRHIGIVGEFGRSHLARLVAEAVRQVSSHIAHGNNLVYCELAPLFVRLINVVELNGAPQPQHVEDLLDAIGVPSRETSPNVRLAFRQYALAIGADDPIERAQRVLAANVSAVLHEQRRLQPDVEAALDAGVIDFGDDLGGIVRGHIADSVLHSLQRHVHVHLAAPIERVWQHVATKLLMTMNVPGQVLHLAEDVPPPPEIDGVPMPLFPQALVDLSLPAVATLMAEWDPTGGTGRGSGAKDWADLRQRMGYIVNLFRSRQQWLGLTCQPFDSTELAWMEQDRLPQKLASGEPAAVRSAGGPAVHGLPADLPLQSLTSGTSGSLTSTQHSTSSGRAAAPEVIAEPLFGSLPLIVAYEGVIVKVSAGVSAELGCDASPLHGTLAELGTPIDGHNAADVSAANPTVRVRLNSSLGDRPVRLRLVAEDQQWQWIEVRSLAAEFRMESLLRRSGIGHMLISPAIELQWSLSANGMLPGDDPLNWIELMDPDDMQTLGKAIHDVGQDPSVQRVVKHRLNADRTYTMIDRVESVMHDPDLRAVLVRSRLEGAPSVVEASDGAASGVGFTITDHIAIGVVVASHSGKVLHRNSAAATLVKARTGQSVLPTDDGFAMVRRLGADDAAALEHIFLEATEGRRGWITVPSPQAADRFLRFAVAPAAGSTVVMTIEDVTELAETERALRASNSLLAALDAHSEELVIVFDAEGTTRYLSSSVRRHLGAGAVIGHRDEFLNYVHPADRQAAQDLQHRVHADPRSAAGVDLRITVEDAAGRWHHATLTNLLGDPDVCGLVLTLRDVHERHLLEHELRFRATHDELTTLPDRAGLRTRLDEVMDSAIQRRLRTAVVFCDIDNFKTINDQFGHHVGDFVLTELASRLRSGLRVTDFVGRFGGDEFVVVFPDVEDADHALALAAGVFRECTGPAVLGPHRVDISVSMGLAVSDSGDGQVELLLQRADQAMYWSKQAGRGRLSLYADSADLAVVVQ
jgi:diguanylate cyclase (GGDEF)-like protein